MSNGDPGKFLTSTVTGGAKSVAGGALKGGLGEAFQGAWLGGSIGSIVPGVGTAVGAGVGAALGASFGSLTGVSKKLTGEWDKLVSVSRKLLDIYAKFSPVLEQQQERWRRLDRQINKAWAKTFEPTLKHITDIGVDISKRWTQLKISVFKRWEGVLNKLITLFGHLISGLLKLLEFFEKLKNLISDIVKFAFTPLMVGLKALAKLLGIFTPQTGKTESGGGPSWGPGATLGYGTRNAAGMGGTPLLRGKFEPGMNVPEWAKTGRLEFAWVKDFKAWLGNYLDHIIVSLGGKKLGEAALSVTDPTLSREYKKAKRKNEKYPLNQPVTEEELEEYRREHNLPKKGSSKGGALLGAAGAVSRAVGMTAFTSLPDPSINLSKPGASKASQLKQRADALWKEYVTVKGWKNYPKGSARYNKIQRAYEAWDEVNQQLEAELISSGAVDAPREPSPEELAGKEQRLNELKISAAKQREELKKYRGVKTSPWQARKESFERDEEALDPDKTE